MADETTYDMILIVRKSEKSTPSYVSVRVHSKSLDTLGKLVGDVSKNLPNARFEEDPTMYGEMAQRIVDKFTETARHYVNNPQLDKDLMYRAIGVDILEEIVYVPPKEETAA